MSLEKAHVIGRELVHLLSIDNSRLDQLTTTIESKGNMIAPLSIKWSD